MKWWLYYQQFVIKNISPNRSYRPQGLAFWRSQLFINAALYFGPVSLIALIPGVIMSVKGNIPMLGVYDVLAVLVWAIIALVPGISLRCRHTLFVVDLYFISIILLVYLGSFGPGLLYLMAISIFVAMVFGTRPAALTVVINLVISLLFALFIHLQWIEGAMLEFYEVGPWLAVSSNLTFLSIVIVAALHLLFDGLQNTIVKEEKLQQELIKESKSLEKHVELLRNKNNELEQFAFIASHDLQEPLQTISSFTLLLEKQYQGRLDEKADLYLDYMEQSVLRMRSLITGLLDYARIGKEKELELTDCNLLLQEVVMNLDSSIKNSGAVISIGKFPEIGVFPNEFKQMFQNLISNAIKFRKEEVKPEISIQAKEQENNWLFLVADNGIGIKKAFWEKIFVIYQRLNSRAKYEGTGIGLAHCKKIAELHEGKIWVESEPGEGSVFYFSMPKK